MHSSRRRPFLVTTLVFAATPGVAQITGTSPNFTLSGGTETRTELNLGDGQILTQTGGTLNAAIQRIGDYKSGAYNISGGVNNATTLYVGTGWWLPLTGDYQGNGGSVVQSGGTVNISGELRIASDFRNQAASYRMSPGALELNVGTVRLGAPGQTNNDARLYLQGGTLTTGSIFKANPAAQLAAVYFGGTTVRATGSTSNFMNNGMHAVIESGLIFDSNGHDVQINASLLHSTDLATDGGVTKIGAGLLRLAAVNTYNGGTTLGAGTLQLSGGGTLGDVSSPVTVNAGLLDFNGLNRTVGNLSGAGGTIANNATGTAITFTIGGGNGGGGTFSGILADNTTGTGTLALAKTGSGWITLAGANTYSGGTAVQAGTLHFSAPAALPAVGALSVSPGATAILPVGGAGLDADGVNARLPAFANGSNLGLDTSAAGSDFTFSATGLTGARGLVKAGSGTLILPNANSYAGPTTVAAGILRATHADALGSSTVGTMVANGAALELQNDITVAAEPLSLSGSGSAGTGALRNLSGANTYAGPITLTAATSIQSDAGTLALTGTLAGGGFGLTLAGAGNGALASALGSTAGSLTKTGTGAWTLSAANTHTGTTTVSAGTLSLTHASALGATIAGTTVASGASLALQNNITLGAEPLSLAGNGHAGNGALRNLGGNNSHSGALTLTAATRLQSDAGNLSLTGPLAGGGFGVTLAGAGDGTLGSALGATVSSLTKTDAGTWTLSGGTSGYTGPVTIGGGTLVLSGAGNFAANTVTLAGGTLRLATNGYNRVNSTFAIGPGGTLDAAGTAFNAHSFQNLTLDGATLTGSNPDPTYGNYVIGTSSLVTVSQSTATPSAITAPRLQLNAGSTLQVGSGAQLSISSTITDTNFNGSTYLSPGSLAKTGAGTLIISGAASHSQGTTISAGTLQIGAGGTTGTIAGNITNNANLAFNRSNAATHAGLISGTGSVTKLGPGTLTLSGSNTYTGLTRVDAGTLAITGDGAHLLTTPFTVNSGATLLLQRNNIYSGHLIASTPVLTLNAGGLVTNTDTYNTFINPVLNGGELRANGGANANFPSFQLKGTVIVGGSTPSQITTTGVVFSGLQLGNNTAGGTTTFQVADVTGNAAADLTVSAVFINGFGGSAPVASGLVKTGPGLLVLAGANTYTGPTLVSAGTLRVNGSSAASAFTVQSGGTLGGTGAVGSVTVQSGGTLAPGASPGLLTVNGPLTLASGSFTTLEIAGLARGTATGYDAFNISGAFTAGGTLSVSFIDGFAPAGSATFDFFNFTSIGGSFAQVNLPTLAGYTWNTSQLSLDGTVSLVASAIPEPAAFAALAGLAAAGVSVSRRRRRRA